ncbi:uncharacterized protein BP01DRAFT_344883 [Aspergillus saccharolyticus JOP 1030-1]|uniref:Uncharacterized protein n=1 Tax=Aspergillus saccharolyticus JOP 1030-1 TaxID=1450539 RepID=A0A318Z835_9EURO|nr:hypothetical protein BP01DRAFT_344883 [Aspergillus saccharolyticus JOP 1030-1]PYH43376.1 hypothetical protein BP01DRAFT_344883 [Aspergillus saccharolyticus JOP 1030-1]
MDAAALLCNICPKRPTFSDVSHLLTHVASKAHLSHYFKLQVRSHQEQQAVDLLDEYDHWYKANNLARLLSDRMSSKEARKKKTSAKSIIQAEFRSETPDLPLSVLPSPHDSFPDYIDPRLADGYADPSIRTCPPYTHTTHGFDPGNCELGLWKHEPRGNADADDDSFALMPYWTNAKEGEINTGLDSLPSGYSIDPFLDDTESTDCLHSSLLDKERADEIARLKGVLWPGMDIFDSATEQMRRRRNQKKDESILKMMEKTSQCVEPTELVFSPTGILRKQRMISGNVEDSSPLKGETPIPKRRVSRPKRVLSQLDANIHRRQVGSNKKRNKKIGRQNVTYVAEPLTQSAAQEHHDPLASEASTHQTNCTTGQTKHAPLKRRSGFKDRNEFSVYRDELGQQHYSSKSQHTSDGLPFSTSAVSHPIFLLHEYTARADICASRSISHVFSPTGRAIDDDAMNKENMEPLFNVCGRIDPLVGWHSPPVKQHLANDIGYPPQLFYQNAQSAGLSPFGSHDSPTGYQHNPLSVSLSRLPIEETNLCNMDLQARQAGGEYKARHNSPEDTISESEEGEFERLYLTGSSY